MKSRSLLLLVALAGAGALRAEVAAPGALDSLVKNSPFGQRTTDGSGGAPGASLELRGVIVDGGEVLFSLFDTSSRTSRWVGLNEAGNPFTVRSYDKAKSEVKVAYQGRELTLGLKQATVIALAAPVVPTPGPVPLVGAVPGNGPQSAAAGAPTDEAVRLAQIAEEIGRRRALRQQALKQRTNPAPATPPK